MYLLLLNKLMQKILIFFVCIFIFIISLIAKNDKELFEKALRKKNIEAFENIQKLGKLQNDLMVEFLSSIKRSIVGEMLPNEITDKANEVSNGVNNLAKTVEECKTLENVYDDFNENTESKDGLFKIMHPRELTKEEKTMKFEDRFNKHYIGGIPSSLEYIIEYIKKHKEYSSEIIGEIPNKILLYGNPGNGKSYLPEVLSVQLQIPLISVSATTLQSKYYGETSKNVCNLVELAQAQNKPVILFIDEVDAIARDRSDDKNEADRSAVNALLTALQRLNNDKNVFVFIATNYIDILDEALKDRFETCEIKDLSLEQRTQFIIKTFKDYGKSVDAEFAKRFAEVISKKFNEKMEFKSIISGIYIKNDWGNLETFIKDGSIGAMTSVIAGVPNIPYLVNASMAGAKMFVQLIDPPNNNEQIKPKIEYVPYKITSSKYCISNRAIKRIIFTAIMAQKVDYEKDQKNSDKKLCQYVRMALDKLKLSNSMFNYSEKPMYCCGI